MTVHQQAFYRAHPAAIDEPNAGGLAVCRTDREGVVALNGSAAHLWRQLRLGAPVEHLARDLVAEFGADPQAAANDASQLLQMLASLGLVEQVASVEAAPGRPAPPTADDRIAALAFVGTLLSPAQPAPEAHDRDGGFWEAVVRLAARYRLSPLLWSRIVRTPNGDRLPGWVAAQLHAQYRLNHDQNTRIRVQALEAVAELNRCGIEPILLKGIAHLFAGTYPDPAARTLSDIDLMVPPEALPEATAALEAIGYRGNYQAPIDYANFHHGAPLYRAGEVAPIELHRAPVMLRFAPLLPTNDAVARSVALDRGVRVLDPTHAALHAVIHAQLVDRYFALGRFPLRELVDFAWLLHRDGDAVDWDEIRGAFASHSRALHAFALAARRLLGTSVPSALGRGLGAELFWWRARSELRREWLAIWNSRIGRLSGESLCRTRGCSGSFLSVNRARLWRIGNYLVSRTRSPERG